MDPEITEFARTYRAFHEAMIEAVGLDRPPLTPLGQHVQDFLGVSLDEIQPITEYFPIHQSIDADLALEQLLAEYGGERQGIGGPQREHMESFADFLNRSFVNFSLGGVDYERKATGPDSDRRIVALGLGEVRIHDVPLVWLQRTASPRMDRRQYSLEVLCPDAPTADAFLAAVRQRMAQLSVLRGQVVSFIHNDFDYHGASSELTFVARPQVRAEEVILPEGTLERVVRHVVGIAEHRDALRAAGQHLKRGVLLYGPPGTGKTHLVRHLLSRTPGTTAVLLSGRTLSLLNEATALAQAMAPAIVVLEDCDLVAEHRGGDTNALLFETLQAMDGLAPDADIAFILTTNRVDLLERALVERPGRVDLAVEIAKPDLESRQRLFRLYAAELLAAGHLTEGAVHIAASRTEGVTASFTKELIRRVAINAAQHERPPRDADVRQALDEMMSDAESLTRTLLGGEGPAFATSGDWEADVGPHGPRPGLAPDGYWSAHP
jgi:predicted AAA+ superfamily ATPase